MGELLAVPQMTARTSSKGGPLTLRPAIRAGASPRMRALKTNFCYLLATWQGHWQEWWVCDLLARRGWPTPHDDAFSRRKVSLCAKQAIDDAHTT